MCDSLLCADFGLAHGVVMPSPHCTSFPRFMNLKMGHSSSKCMLREAREVDTWEVFSSMEEMNFRSN